MEKENDRDQFFTRYGINRFPERLKEAMTNAHIPSNNQLAKKTELSEATIRKYLKRETYPTLDRLALLADACDCSLAWLAAGEGDENYEEAKINLKFGNKNENNEDELDLILKRLPQNQRNALVDAIIQHGVAGIINALNDTPTK